MSEKTQNSAVTGQSRSRSGDPFNMMADITKFTYSRKGRVLSNDHVIVEQPLQISILWEEQAALKSRVFSITMRTPGHDVALIYGLLLTEGIIEQVTDIESVLQEADVDERCNKWEVKLHPNKKPALSSLEKFQLTYSSCGLCGTTSLKTLELKNPPSLSDQTRWLLPDTIYQLPDLMRAKQALFAHTGSVHAAALFEQNGAVIALHEDIGRHNAVDKVIGAYVTGTKHVDETILLVSGRISFEIVQKAVMAGVSVLVAVGAPSDLAIIAARRFNLTLIGFATDNSFNLYHGEWRLHSLGESCQKI